MSKKDSRIDAYIERSAEFARPILNHLRNLVHTSCPKVEETIKWNSPFYLHQGILIATPAFKKHCALIFWKNQLVFGKAAASQRKKFHHLNSADDLPGDKILIGYLRKAIEVNEAGAKTPRHTKTKAKKKIVVPDCFLAALRKNKKALTTFENFSPSHKHEYVEWIVGARREETRAQRIKTAIEWITKGKSRNWKYQ
jgi:uncharacterized protein YdeI (YjbR/CyaY-like superfamily)